MFVFRLGLSIFLNEILVYSNIFNFKKEIGDKGSCLAIATSPLPSSFLITMMNKNTTFLVQLVQVQ